MSQDYTPLALDDLVHIMSPSPAPQALTDDSEPPLRGKSASPEPLQESDILQIRKQILDMRILDKGQHHSSVRERELAEMVLRLTSTPRPDADQIFRQAEMISALTQQRDLLIHQAEEQRLRWTSEKDGWARMSEALLAQQAKLRNLSDRDEDTERINSTVEADNKNLRQRLSETQSRLQMLEAELSRLRPLLLMQPLASPSISTPHVKQHHPPRRRKKDAAPPHAAADDEGRDASEDDVPPTPLDSQATPTQAQHVQITPKTKSRKSEGTNNIYPQSNLLHHHKRRSSLKNTSRGLSADARAEHLLLAARKIGKQRAGILSGMMQRFEERERERRREDSATTFVATATTPKTPKRTAQHPGYPSEGVGYMYVNSPVRPGPGMHPVPVLIPAYPHLLNTPSSTTTAASTSSSAQQSAQKQDTRTQNPQTPLDSLLSAARSMMHEDDDDDEDNTAAPNTGTGTRRARSSDLPDSPLPKRRRVAPRGDKLAASKDRSGSISALPATATAGVGRVRSALDVLADQAAAFSSQELAASQSQAPRKGKGKERAVTSETSTSPPKGKEGVRSHKKASEVDTPSATPMSRSRTPRSELESDSAVSSSRTSQPQNGGAVSEAPGDPGGKSGHASMASLARSAGTAPGQGDQAMSSAPDEASTSRSPQTPTTHHGHVADLDATPTQAPSSSANPSSRAQSEGLSSSIQPIPHDESTPASIPQRAASIPASTSLEDSRTNAQNHQRPETTPAVSSSGQNATPSAHATATARNKDLARVAGQDAPPAKRQRSPYVKWSKEEDDLLAQAVAKYGQKWDLVQKALPSRGYHQVRQRWLRKLGVFDSKPDLSSFQTAAFPSASRLTVGESGNSSSAPIASEPPPNPKLGLAPLSSELAFSSLLAGRGEGRSSARPS